MNKTFTCILCPNGCEIAVAYEGANINSLNGALCDKGENYVTQELIAPMRNIATLVKVEGGKLPLTSVRLSKPIPKKYIFEVMSLIRKQALVAPTSIGQIVIKNVLGLGSDVVVTKNVDAV
jgi:CxxC motif-containing protein